MRMACRWETFRDLTTPPGASGRSLLRAIILSAVVGMGLFGPVARAIALPPPEDLPEEVARTEIIIEARSPVDGEPLTAVEYVELQAELAEREYPAEVSSELQQLIFLLRVRRLIRTFTPFSF